MLKCNPLLLILAAVFFALTFALENYGLEKTAIFFCICFVATLAVVTSEMYKDLAKVIFKEKPIDGSFQRKRDLP